jgi:hypothetical protein
MSRAIDDAPTILSLASRIGDTVTVTATRRPSFLSHEGACGSTSDSS